MTPSVQELMRAAARLTQAGDLQKATEAIQRALVHGADAMRSAGNPFVPPGTEAPAQPPGEVLDGCVFEVGTASAEGPAERRAAGAQESFTAGVHRHAGRTLRYKLYLPPLAPQNAASPMPLVVMLHGCTQDPEDFAAGTGMNTLARAQGFAVLYPAQSQEANPSRCWNWFKHNHQQRGSGEPAVLASLTQTVVREQGLDPRRVYVAGLSAGGAMAAIVAAEYPEIFAAAGVHSGLAAGAARDLPGAMAAMHSGAAGQPGKRLSVPTIVFHGDQDTTVHPRNGEQVIAAVHAAPGAKTEQGVAPRGRRYTRSVYAADAGGAAAEHWVVHGAGHAWAGGTTQGSYTDPQGPDASREMLRFFLAHPRA